MADTAIHGHVTFTEVESGIRHVLEIGPGGRIAGTLATGASIIGRLTAATNDGGDGQAPHRLTIGRTDSGVPWFQLEHADACGRLGCGQRCPFDSFEGAGGVDDRPKQPGIYFGYYSAGKYWTDVGWEYDARIEWELEGDDGH